MLPALSGSSAAAESPPEPCRLAIATGGTAGHVFPALAIAQAWVETGGQVSFIGAREGLEQELITEAGWDFEGLSSRPFFGVSALGRLTVAGTLALAVSQCRRVLSLYESQVVLGMGGHVSAAALLAARSLGIPCAQHEANVQDGLGNRLVAPLTQRRYRGFPERPRKSWGPPPLVVGTPVRTDLIEHRPAPSTSPCRILVLGGSLGNTFLNRQVPALLAALASLGTAVHVTHQSGEGDMAQVRAAYHSLRVEARVLPFIEEMGAAYGEADFVVTSAGGATLAELAVYGPPCLLVPLGAASEDHQRANAEVYAAATGVPWVTEGDWDAHALAGLLHEILGDPQRWRSLLRGLRSYARPAAAQTMVEDLLDLAGAERPEGEAASGPVTPNA